MTTREYLATARDQWTLGDRSKKAFYERFNPGIGQKLWAVMFLDTQFPDVRFHQRMLENPKRFEYQSGRELYEKANKLQAIKDRLVTIVGYNPTM